MTIHPTLSGPVPRLTFGRGLGDLAASAITRIDSNPLNQLMVLDVGGMVLPRSALEYKERGVDMGRETLIREGGGTLSTVFLAGWMGSLVYGVYRLLDSFFSINKRGIHFGSWISAQSMDRFSNLLEETMKETPSGRVEAIRETFIRKVLEGLQATDHVQANRINQDLLGKLTHQRMAQIIRKNLSEKVAQGHLAKEALETLVSMYDRSGEMEKGIYKVFERAIRWKNLQRAYEPLQDEAKRLIAQIPEWRILPEKQAMDLAFERLLAPKTHAEIVRLSKSAQKASKNHVGAMIKVATEGGLTDTVNWVDRTGTSLLKGRKLPVVLRELKYFLEQYMDRVLSDPLTGQLRKKLDDVTKEQTMGLLDDLIRGVRKTKLWLTALPFLAALGLASIVAPLNNWWTKQKHVGKVFFPGEGGPPKGKGNQVFRSIRGGASPVKGRHYGAFQLFEQQQRAGTRSGMLRQGALQGGGQW